MKPLRASDLLDTFNAAGMALSLTSENGLKVTPAKALTNELRETIKANKAMLVDYLQQMAANDSVAKPPMDPDRWCWPHSAAMNGQEIDTFTARLARLTDKGASLEEAERLTAYEKGAGDGTTMNTADVANRDDTARPDASAGSSLPVPVQDGDGALSEREKAAKAKMFNALGKLAALASKNTRMNWTPEEEQQLLPIVIELFDGAMELGAVKFKQAVAYVRDFIANGIDSETADAIPFETLQGAYIAVAGRHQDKPVTPKREVAGFESLDELNAQEDNETPTQPQASTAPTSAQPEIQDDPARNGADDAEPLDPELPQGNPGLAQSVAPETSASVRPTDADGNGRPDRWRDSIRTGVGRGKKPVLSGSPAEVRPVGRSPVGPAPDATNQLFGEAPSNYEITDADAIGEGNRSIEKVIEKPTGVEFSGLMQAARASDTRFNRIDGRQGRDDTAADGTALDTSPAAQRNIGVLERAIARDSDGTRAAVEVHPYEARVLPNQGALREIAEAFGSRIQGFGLRRGLLSDDIDRYGFFNGVRTGGVVFLASRGNTRPHMAILGHELAHELRTNRPDLYDRLVEGIRPYVDQKKYREDFLPSEVARNAGSRDKQREEFVGEVLSDGFMDREFWRALGNKNPGLLRQIGGAVMALVENVLELIVVARNRRVAQGMPIAQALTEAVAAIAPKFAPAGAATHSRELPGNNPKQDTRTTQAIQRGAQATIAQPPAIQAGVGNRATAVMVDPATMTDEQFNALSEAEKARMRGDSI